MKPVNQESIDHAFKAYYKSLVAFAYTFLENSQEAEDCVQEGFTSLLLRPHKWSEVTDLRAYLFKTVQNRCLSLIRNKAREGAHINAYHSYQTIIRHHHTEPEIISRLIQRDDSRLVDKLLSLISPKRSTALQLVYLEEQGYAQSANKLDVSLNTLKSTLRLAKRDIISKILSLLPFFVMAIS